MGADSSEDNVRYVVAGMPTGWAAINKTIREVDEDKVKDYKEDIDTLLVFTGLFSAVLTAFVIVSYPTLSTDTAQDAATPLRAQVAPKPSLTALRINYLWFASLIITLITASFSMLVKQWLREYLAFDYTSPQARLRARQFRHPGLSTWMVYEIGGVLPLLLQLALGLFFIGLCFFTQSEEHGIGTMCTTLVGLWAFCFVSVSIAPIASARCPYKTALLKRLIRILRHHLRYFLHPHFAKFFVEEADAITQDTDIALLREVDSFLLDDDFLGTTILESLMQTYTDPSDVIKFAFHALALRLPDSPPSQPLVAPLDLRRLTKRGWIAVTNVVAATVLKNLSARAVGAGPWVQDAIYLLLSFSDQSLTPSARDAILHCIQKSTLAEVTRAIVTPSSSGTRGRVHDLLDPIKIHLIELVSRHELSPPDVIIFVLQILSTETHAAAPPLPLPSILDLKSVSKPLWQFSSNVLGTMIEGSLGPDPDSQSIGPWLESAILILLSNSLYPSTPVVSRVFARLCSVDAPRDRFGACIWPLVFPESDAFVHVLARLRQMCKEITSDDAARWLFHGILRAIPCTERCTHSTVTEPSTALLLADHASHHTEWTRHFSSILVERCTTLFAMDIEVSDQNQPGARASIESFWALLSLPVSSHSLNPDIPRLVFDMISDFNKVTGALQALLSTYPPMHALIVSDAAIHCITSLVVEANTEGRRKVVHAMWWTINGYVFTETREHFLTLKDMNIVRHIFLASTIHASIQLDHLHRENWAKYYATCGQAMVIFRRLKYPSLPDEEKTQTALLAEECLRMLDSMEPVAGDLDRREFDAHVSVFPDTVYRELAAFVPDGVASRYQRVQRLKNIALDPAASDAIHLPHEGFVGMAANFPPMDTSFNPLAPAALYEGGVLMPAHPYQ